MKRSDFSIDFFHGFFCYVSSLPGVHCSPACFSDILGPGVQGNSARFFGKILLRLKLGSNVQKSDSRKNKMLEHSPK